jgi:UDP-GlcNAc:undecaprenyl-phosphate GlcNAc-1-phosphate transferase
MEFITSRFLLAGAISLIVTLIATPFVIKIAHRFDAIDQPGEERRIHTTPTPRWGGLAIYLGVLAAWLVVYPLMHRFRDVVWIGPFSVKSLWIMGLSAAVVLFGMLDDKYQFKASRQAIFLLACGVFLSHPSFGGIRIEGFTNFFTHEYIQLSQLNSVLLTTLFVFVVTKTVDLTDGIDGLTAGVCAIIASTMFFLALHQQPLIGVLTAGVIGACLGFLRYNYHPAKIFMGTGGSQFLGFILAAISIDGVVKTAAAAAILAPLLVFGLPLLDAALVVIRRVISRAPITQADKRHLHHTLLHKGLNQRQTAWVLYLVTLTLCAAATVLVKLIV